MAGYRYHISTDWLVLVCLDAMTPLLFSPYPTAAFSRTPFHPPRFWCAQMQ